MHGKVEIATAAVTEWVGRRVEEAGRRKEYIGFLLTGDLDVRKVAFKGIFQPEIQIVFIYSTS